MPNQLDAQGYWRALIEKNAHLRRFRSTTGRMLERRPNLVQRNSLKPLNEVRSRRPFFEIFE